MSQIWSWVMAGTSIYCLWLTGRQPRASWWLTIASQTLWITYAILAKQWGFIASSCCFVAISIWNLYSWRNGPPAGFAASHSGVHQPRSTTATHLTRQGILMMLDPLARSELETIAENWRDVHPAGSTYTTEILRVLDQQKTAGQLTGDEALDIFMRIASYGTHKTDQLVLPTIGAA